MSLERELQEIKREQELALRAAQEAERKAKAHRSRLQQAILSQRQAIVARWSRTVSALLEEVGRAAWGEEGYTLIEPDGVSSLSWAVVHVEGKTKWNYQVTLKVEEASVDDLSLTPEDTLIRASSFVVKGAQEFTCSLSQDDLKEALVSAYRSGPKENGLDRFAETILARSPYKKGEFESPNNWLLLFTFLTGLSGLGISLIGFLYVIAIVSDPQSVESLPVAIGISLAVALVGIGMLVISGVALWRTSFGKRFQRLPGVEKILAVIAAIPGAFVAFAMSVGLIAVVIAIFALLAGAAASAGREQRVSEIEEGVRRAIR